MAGLAVQPSASYHLHVHLTATVSDMTYLILSIHSILAVLLVVLILLHSGKGGGVSGIFGGGMSDTFSGTSVIEKNLTRVTVLVATAFFITTSLLVFVPALRA